MAREDIIASYSITMGKMARRGSVVAKGAKIVNEAALSGKHE